MKNYLSFGGGGNGYLNERKPGHISKKGKRRQNEKTNHFMCFNVVYNGMSSRKNKVCIIQKNHTNGTEPGPGANNNDFIGCRISRFGCMVEDTKMNYCYIIGLLWCLGIIIVVLFIMRASNLRHGDRDWMLGIEEE